MAEAGFWKLAEQSPESLAVVDPGGQEVTAGELLGDCNQLVHGLRALGLRPGDSIAMVLPNCREVFELYLAVLQAGWYLVPINHHLVGPEIAYIVKDSDAKVLVVHERFGAECTRAVEELGFDPQRRFSVGALDGFADYASLKQGQPRSRPPGRTTGAVMNYTSGTTGAPKGVRRALPGTDPDEAGLGFGGMLLLFGLQPRDANVHLCGSPLYHTAVMVFAGGSLHLGHTVVLMDKWTPEGMLELIQRYRVTTSHMVPTQFHRLLALPEEVKRSYDVSSLRHVIHAAAPCPVDVKRRMIEWWGPVIDEYYAASEGGGTIVFPDEWMRKPGTVGRPWPISEVVVLDDEGNQLPPGQVGTVYMSMKAPDFEYYKDKEKTERNRVGRFFTVGDVGYFDQDGYLFLCDRKSDMIISGGANIYPAEIEAVLLGHPKVADAAVFGIPHEDWGEEVKAVIEPAPGVEPGPELEAEILAWCEGRLARFKTPKSVDFVSEMPRDPNGKLYKRKLRDPYWQGRERAI
ncbi:MAG TPA: acyl-CoA synthetase [Acidimicrobiales bacterium]|jgi:long-chain acyl-CoA synthetase|nr:acyl-CoA synthetase [Acidimicrobiales bacterium]